jgi:hypothetical protein
MGQRSYTYRTGMGLRKSFLQQAVPPNRNSEATHPASRLLFGGMSKMRCRSRRLVQPGQTDAERQTAANPRGAQRLCREVQSYRLAHVSPHLPFVAGRDGSADEGATRTDAARLYPDHDEHLWSGGVELEAGGQQQSRGDGTQASTRRAPETRNFAIGSQWE